MSYFDTPTGRQRITLTVEALELAAAALEAEGDYHKAELMTLLANDIKGGE